MDGYCQRCRADVQGVYANPGMRKVARVYLLLPLPFVPVLPIMAADYVVCLPLLMVWMLGVGPVLRILHDPACCPDCDANVTPRGDPDGSGRSRWRILQWAGRVGRRR
jgi:hypothetical protein